MDTTIELEIGPGPEPGTYVVRVLRSVGGGEPVETITLDVDELVVAAAARRGEHPVVVGLDPPDHVGHGGRGAGRGRPPVRRHVHRRHPHRVPDERGRGRRAREGRADRAPAGRAGPRRAAVGGAVRFGDAGVPLPQGAARASRAGAVLAARAHGHPAAQGPRDDLVAGRPARARRRGGARPARGGAPPAPRRGRVELHWLDDVSWTGVHDKLLEEEWHVLHFIGHGGYDTETDEGVLAFVGRNGRADYVAARGSPTSSTRPSRRRDSSC